MKKLVSLSLICVLSLGIQLSTAAATKVGGSCAQVNQFREVGSNILVCALSKKKKLWRKATPLERSLYIKEKTRLANQAAQKAIEDERVAAATAEAKAAADAKAAKVQQMLLMQKLQQMQKRLLKIHRRLSRSHIKVH
jgi:hypothetical protein